MNSNNTKPGLISPWIEVEKKEDLYENPFVQLDGRDGDEGVFIITKEDKQYVRGDKLFFKYKGIGIFADINDAISVNTYNDELYIFRHDELSPPEDREYLLLLVYNDESLIDTFIGISGRQEVFNYIVRMADMIDFEKSKILAETTKLKDLWSIHKFMKMCINNEMVKNDTGFDPDDYHYVLDNMED